MPSVFINYRVGDEENVAGLVERELSSRFDRDVFFRASKSIRLGDDFEEELLEAVRESNALIAVIGPRWLDVREGGRRKIDREDDWARREILEAFRCGVRVIPLLVGQARPLSREDLPPELARLAVCQYARLGYRSLDADLDRLATELALLVPGLKEKKLKEKKSSASSGHVSNRAYGDAQIGVQGVVNGDVSFGDFGARREPRRAAAEPGDEDDR